MDNKTLTMPAADKPSASADKLVRGTVAHGRTIVKPDPSRRVVVGHKDDGTPIFQAVKAEFGPGKEVDLSEPEMKYYKELGFIVDPDRKVSQYEGASVIHP